MSFIAPAIHIIHWMLLNEIGVFLGTICFAVEKKKKKQFLCFCFAKDEFLSRYVCYKIYKFGLLTVVKLITINKRSEFRIWMRYKLTDCKWHNCIQHVFTCI